MDMQSYVPGLPVVSFRFSDAFKQENPEVQQVWVQTLLRAKGWIVPNYELAPDMQNVEILRVVVRETLTAVMVDRLVADIVSSLSPRCLSRFDRTVVSLRSRSSRVWRRRIPRSTH